MTFLGTGEAPLFSLHAEGAKGASAFAESDESSIFQTGQAVYMGHAGQKNK